MEKIPKNMAHGRMAPKEHCLMQPVRTNIQKTHKKSYIDNLILLKRISLRNLMEKQRIIRPATFHGRFYLKMPPQKRICQHQLEDLVQYTQQNKIILNQTEDKMLTINQFEN